MRGRRVLLLLAIAAGSAPMLRAQLPRVLPAAPRDLGAVAPHSPKIDAMKVALKHLVTLQEKYWRDHGTYTTDGSALGIYPLKSGQPAVQVIFAGSRGWTGMATDQGLKGKSCVIYVGDERDLPGGPPKTADSGLVAKAEGLATCDDP